MENLNFNEMLNKCWETALGMTKMAKLYQGSSPHDLSFIHCIFRGNDEYATINQNHQSKATLKSIFSLSRFRTGCASCAFAMTLRFSS